MSCIKMTPATILCKYVNEEYGIFSEVLGFDDHPYVTVRMLDADEWAVVGPVKRFPLDQIEDAKAYAQSLVK